MRLAFGIILGVVLTLLVVGSWPAKFYDQQLATPQGKAILQKLPESVQKQMLRLRDAAARARRCGDACEAARNACERGGQPTPSGDQ